MSRRTILCTSLLIASLFATTAFIASVQQGTAKKTASQTPPPATKPAATPAAKPATPPRDEVAAIVNGEKIMLSELLGRLDELGVAPERREAVAGNVLDGIVENLLVVQFLTAQRISYDVKAVDAQIVELRAEYEKSGKKLSEALAQLGLNEQKLRAAAIAEAQWQSYLKKNVTDRQLAEYFAKYREFFDGAQVRASHILIEVPADADAKARADAKAKIERVKKEVASGGDFATVAKKYSNCPSKEMGGDVDWFPRRDKMVDSFAKAAFALKQGETSGVVETEFGYHIIKCTGRKPGTRTKLEDPQLRAEVLESLGEQLKDELIAKQRKVAKIEIAPGVPAPEQPKIKTATQPTGKTKK